MVSLENRYYQTEEQYKAYRKLKKIFMLDWDILKVSQLKHLTKWFKQEPMFYHLYMVKEAIKDIYVVTKSKEEATILFDAWIKFLPDTKEIISIIQKANRRCKFDTIVRKSLLEVNSSNREVDDLSTGLDSGLEISTPKQREKIAKIYNCFSKIDYSINFPIAFSNKLQEYMYLFFKSF